MEFSGIVIWTWADAPEKFRRVTLLQMKSAQWVVVVPKDQRSNVAFGLIANDASRVEERHFDDHDVYYLGTHR